MRLSFLPAYLYLGSLGAAARCDRGQCCNPDLVWRDCRPVHPAQAGIKIIGRFSRAPLHETSDNSFSQIYELFMKCTSILLPFLNRTVVFSFDCKNIKSVKFEVKDEGSVGERHVFLIPTWLPVLADDSGPKHQA